MGLPLIWDESVADFRLWQDFKRPDLEPGTACWGPPREGEDPVSPKRLYYVCPCGCSEWRQIPVRMEGAAGTAWVWNGDVDRPTLTPSIQHVANRADKCSWHGFLTNGEWVTC